MKQNLLVLIPSKEIIKSAYSSAVEHFRLTGDESVYALPNYIILGYTSKNSFERRTLSHKIEFKEEMVKTSFGFVLPLEDPTYINLLQDEYALNREESGLWFSNNMGWSVKMPHSEKQKLALLKWHIDGYLLLQ